MRYLDELLKFKPLSEFEAKELEVFTKLSAILDSEDMVKFLLKTAFASKKIYKPRAKISKNTRPTTTQKRV